MFSDTLVYDITAYLWVRGFYPAIYVSVLSWESVLLSPVQWWKCQAQSSQCCQKQNEGNFVRRGLLGVSSLVLYHKFDFYGYLGLGHNEMCKKFFFQSFLFYLSSGWDDCTRCVQYCRMDPGLYLSAWLMLTAIHIFKTLIIKFGRSLRVYSYITEGE